jgi:hypothetical protein
MKKTLLVLTLLLAGCGAKPVAPVALQATTPSAQGIFNRPVQLTDEVNHVFDAYDHNRDGKIEAVAPGGVWSPWVAKDERVRKETIRSEDRDSHGFVVRVTYTTYTYAHRDLFQTADTNHDTSVTREELGKVLAGFDKDHDELLTRRGLWGWITRKEKGEYDLYQGQYGEELIDTHRDVFGPGHHALEQEATMVSAPTAAEDLKSAFDAK